MSREDSFPENDFQHLPSPSAPAGQSHQSTNYLSSELSDIFSGGHQGCTFYPVNLHAVCFSGECQPRVQKSFTALNSFS